MQVPFVSLRAGFRFARNDICKLSGQMQTRLLGTKTIAGRKKAVARAVDLLRKSEVVALPTETVYGLAADALNPIAVAKIFEAKDRPRFDPLTFARDGGM